MTAFLISVLTALLAWVLMVFFAMGSMTATSCVARESRLRSRMSSTIAAASHCIRHCATAILSSAMLSETSVPSSPSASLRSSISPPVSSCIISLEIFAFRSILQTGEMKYMTIAAAQTIANSTLKMSVGTVLFVSLIIRSSQLQFAMCGKGSSHIGYVSIL